jgi:peroxiredoxin
VGLGDVEGIFMRLKIIVLAAALCLAGASAGYADSNVGEEAGAFIVPTREGKSFDLDALRGKVVLVNFWATWCPPCRQEMPMLESVWREYHSQGLEMVAVSVDRSSTKRHVKEVASYFSFPIAMYDDIKKNELITVKWVPVTILIGKDGKVSNVIYSDSDISENEFRQEVQTLLAVKPGAKKDKKAEEPVAEKVEEKKADDKKGDEKK